MGNKDKRQKTRYKRKRTARNATGTKKPVVAASPSDSETDIPCDVIDFNIILDCSILKSIIDVIGKCPECDKRLHLTIDTVNKKGLSLPIKLSCCCCDWNHTVYSSSRLDKSDDKSRFEVNLRSVMAFREIGKGLTALESFCSVMNMPSPVSNVGYARINNLLHKAYTEAAQDSMENAAKVVRNNTDMITDIVASFDGTWQRRGYASLNGIVTCIERVNDKCIDIEIKTKECKSCNFWEKKDKGSDAYQTWKDTHQCSINHDGSSASMETSGVLSMFKRSVDSRKLRYKTFIGDGDSSSYPNVVKEDPYPGLVIKKGECIGHVQKRVGSNLRRLRKKLPADRKKAIFGKGKLTDASINYIQNCYGLAIRQNTGNLYQMVKNVAAILPHCSDNSDDAQRHKYCNREEDSWCSYWNKTKQYKHKFSIKESVQHEPEIKSLFERLREHSLLEKCLHGKTQNVNEAMNGIIWTKCPKIVYVNRQTLELGTASALLEFNEGKEGIHNVMSKLGLTSGVFGKRNMRIISQRRKRHLVRKTLSPVKRRRKEIRANRKHWADTKHQEEETTYKAGSFHM